MSTSKPSFFTWRTIRWALLGLGIVVTLVALFYTVEDWRGKRAWENCKRELAAQGVQLDWTAYLPPPVPDDQNFFKAPKMQEWFVGRGQTGLLKHLSLSEFERQYRVTVAEVRVTSSGVTPAGTDLVLDYDEPFLKIGKPQVDQSSPAQPEPPAIPVIEMNDIPLPNAIKTLAQRANQKYSLDPKLRTELAGLNGTPLLAQTVSLRWTNVTARGAMLALLNNYDLMLVEDPKTDTALITLKRPNEVRPDPDVQARLAELVRRTCAAETNGLHGPTLLGARDFPFVAQALNPVNPARIVVRTKAALDARELEKFFPAMQAEPTGGNTFRLLLNPQPCFSAADFLAWSDPFESDFDLIRNALQRPYALMVGDYNDPASQPLPNFVCVRITAQTLADRVKCNLLLGRPEMALKDLTLIHDMCRLLEGPPSGKPMTLVAAMINVAVTGLYADTIADGLRLHAWHEPQLIALEAQLKDVNLLPLVRDALATEPAAVCRMLETAPLPTTRKVLVELRHSPSKLALLGGWLLPRGWVYQNMATIATLSHQFVKAFDATNSLPLPDRAANAALELKQIQASSSPYTMLARIALPNYVKAWESLALNQTEADEARVACALERYLLAHHHYPENLDALVPAFLDALPHDIINGQSLKYRRTANDQFVLYSVGWNKTDDGGKVVSTSAGGLNPEEGDWVWLHRGG